MSWPLPDTGVGKIGESPPMPQALNATAPRTRPIVQSSSLSTRTARKYPTDAGEGEAGARLRAGHPLESEPNRGQSQKASLRRRFEPEPGRGMSPLRPPDGPVHRPLPQLRLQALAVRDDGVGGVSGLAGGRPGAPRGLAFRPRAARAR